MSFGRVLRYAVCVGVLVIQAPALVAQSAASASASAPAPASTPTPDPADVASVDAIITALYASISGPKGAPRDFDRLRTLMGPNARFVPTGVTQAGASWLRNWSVEEYITAAGPGLMANGFFEKEIGRRSDKFGQVTHVWSAYDSRTTPTSEPFQRGINSIQLFNNGKRWFILSVMWDSEREGNPIPADRLGSKGEED
ncbi:MAG: hypothetical protein IBJ03_02525 [Gemmatimonadaceae bacterium]|nr:hypothetical protein [Gemmatimonadaceae bacterium]